MSSQVLSAWIRRRIKERPALAITAPAHVHLTQASLHLAYLATSDAMADYANEAPVALRWRYASLSDAEQPRYDRCYDATLAAMARGNECPHCLCGMAEDALRDYLRERHGGGMNEAGCHVCQRPRPTLWCDICGSAMCDTAACAQRRGNAIWCIACADTEPVNKARIDKIQRALQEAKDEVAMRQDQLEEALADVYDLEKELTQATRSLGWSAA